MRWLVLVLCALTPTVAAAEQRLPIGSASGALFYWHGHRISPPYVVEIGFEPAPETTWTATYVNGLPVDGHSPPDPPAVDFADPSLTPDQQSLERITYRETRFDGERGFDLRAKIERRAEILRSEPSLVDSVRVRTGASMTVYWRGSRTGGFSTDGSSFPPISTVDWWRSGQDAARSLLTHLAGGVILWSGGSRIYFGRRPGIESELDRFAAGEGPAPTEVRNPRVLAELRSPEPIAELVERSRPQPWSPPPCGMPRTVDPSAVRRITLEHTSSDALAFARGRPIAPPFDVAAEYIADPDTVWMTLLLNDAPVWRRPSTPVNWIVQRGAPCSRPPEFGMLSFTLRSGGMVIAGADSAVYVPRCRRAAYQVEIDSLRAGRQTSGATLRPVDLRESFAKSRN